MSKAVLISIQPKWCEKIARGEKTIEVRKNRPKLETPFKCYIYCTANGITAAERDGNIFTDLRCKVIGEFVCEGIEEYYADKIPFGEYDIDDDSAQTIGLTGEELWTYGQGKTLYGWYISDLVIYDRPFELRHFVTEGECDCMNCRGTKKTLKPLFRPPQSWCYVEKVQSDG